MIGAEREEEEPEPDADDPVLLDAQWFVGGCRSADKGAQRGGPQAAMCSMTQSNMRPRTP